MASLSGVNGTNGFRIDGISPEGNFGASVSNAGDINGDGIDDFMIGAPAVNDDAASYDSDGRVYVIYGGTSPGATFDINSLDGSNGFVIDPVYADSKLGFSVSSAGDVNGDGYDDIIIGADNADVNGNNSAGESYVVFGSGTGFSASLDLATLDGSNGFSVSGLSAYDGLGLSVSGAGDVNGDGFDDVIIGAPDVDNGAEYNAGQSYVIYGRSSGFSANIDPSTLNGSDGFKITGAQRSVRVGYQVSDAGDLNGDGYDDVVVSFPQGQINIDGELFSDLGGAHVIFGQATGTLTDVDVTTLNGSNGFSINGLAAGTGTGWSIANAGDVNGDGLDDMLISANEAYPNNVDNAGASYVIFGSTSGFAATLDLNSLDGSDGFRIIGAEELAQSGYSTASAGDVNGDGIDDIIIGAPGASPDGMGLAGSAHVILGRDTGFAAEMVLGTANDPMMYRLDGIDGASLAGLSVSGAGDVNNDGYDDVIIGAAGADLGLGFETGQSFVVYGGPGGLLAPANAAPVFAALPDVISVDENTSFTFTFSASDADALDSIALSAELIRPNGSAVNPNRFSLTDNGDGTASFTWQVPDRLADVSYTVNLTADDGVNAPVTDSFIIDVQNTNAPVIAPLDDMFVDERSNIAFDVMASDVDGDETVMLEAVLYRPNGQLANSDRYSFTDNGDGTGSFSWDTPTRAADGDYTLRILADDGDNHVITSDMTITVLETDDLGMYF